MKRLFLFVLFCSCQMFSKTEVEADDLFNKAKEYAFSNQRQQALEICKEIIYTHTPYRDAYILMGRINAWDKKFHQSRIIFKDVFK